MPRPYRFLGVIAAGVILWAFFKPAGVDPAAWRLFAVFAATILGMILQVMDTGAVVLLGLIAAILTRSMTLTAVLGGFANSSVWLIVSAFLFSHAVAATGLGQRVAFLFIRAFGRKTLGLGYALAASELVMAPAVPANTARAGGVMFPILMSISRACGSFPGTSPRRVGAFLMLNQFHTTIVLSAMFLTSMAANPLIAELSERTAGVKIGWTLWAQTAWLPGLLSLIAVPWVLYRLHPPEMVESPEAPAEARRRLAELGPMKRSEISLALIVGCCLLLWATTGVHRLDPTSVAFLGLAAMLLTGVMAWKDVLRTTGAWDALLWFGGLVAMADWLSRLGMTTWFAQTVAAHVHGHWSWILLILALVYFYSHYGFASLTAHVTAMYGPFLAVAVAAGAPAPLAALVLAFLSNLNACLTHYSTGPAPILFGAGYVTQTDWWKLGFVVSMVNLAIWGGVGLPYWKWIGIW
ncbi:MAG: DASS family sodium-coupled anion symporter [Acidobacteria bacterium]|nr:DASS family sodium-coupled anion symporter [Acidobacteriota bacterium]